MTDYTVLANAFPLVGRRVSLTMHNMNQTLRGLVRVEEVKQAYGVTRLRITALDPITGDAFDTVERPTWVDASRVRVVG